MTPPTPDVTRVLSVDRAVADDPYPIWAELRASCPVYQEPTYRVMVVSRYDDIVDVARRPQDFSSVPAAYGPLTKERGDVPDALCGLARRAGTPGAEPPGTVEALLASYEPVIQDQLQHVDPPLHTRHRRLVSRWFTPEAVALREPAVRAIAAALVDRFAAGGRVEILDAFAGPLPATVVAEVIGIPAEHHDLFLDWREEIIGNPDAESNRVTSERYRTIRALFGDFVARRRVEPVDDLISTLATARTVDGEPLDDTAVLGLLMLFLGGGQETTGKALTTGLRLLAERPGLQAALRADPSRRPAFIEEVLRYDPPVRGIFRIARHDTRIGGTAVPEGTMIQLLWGSGNRDDAVFADPDTFDPTRTLDGPLPRPVLTFGHGVHLCPGAPLARLQLRVGFDELLDRFADIRLAPDNPFRYFPSQILRGLAGLWLELDPA
jgi:cytochrome P450